MSSLQDMHMPDPRYPTVRLVSHGSRRSVVGVGVGELMTVDPSSEPFNDSATQSYGRGDDEGDGERTRTVSLVSSVSTGDGGGRQHDRGENEKRSRIPSQRSRSRSRGGGLRPGSGTPGVPGGGIGGRCPPPPVPFQARFWSNDPTTAAKRKLYLGIVAKSTVLIILVIFTILSIYWGSLFNVQKYIHNLEGWVVDFDGGPIGQAVIKAFQNNTGRPQQMTWRVVDASQFPNFPNDVVNSVVDQKTWAAITINPGASGNLSQAIANVDSAYDGSRAVTAYAVQARNNNGYGSFIQPMIMTGLQIAVQSFAVQNSQQLANNDFVDVQALFSQAPNVLTAPLYFTTVNLRPFDKPVAQAVDFVGLIYLLIISFIACMVNYQARVIASGLNRHLKLSSLLAIRIVIPFVNYFVVSLFFSLLSLAFQAPFSRFFGHWGFLIYWMMNWMGMLALGLAMESMITILTPAFVPFFLILWIISNVAVASIPIEVLPGIFKYGYATPFYNISETVRTILFNTRNHIGLNFGVQLAWIGVSLLTMTSFTILMRRNEERAWLRQQEATTNASRERA